MPFTESDIANIKSPLGRRIKLKVYKFFQKIFEGSKLTRFNWIRLSHDFVMKQVRSEVYQVGGHIMYLDDKDILRLSINGVYESRETSFIEQEISEGEVVVDIGAHIGYYTLIFARLVGPTGKVIAFEPDPDTFNLLKKNIEVNGYENVVAINKGVAQSPSKQKLYRCSENSSDQMIYNNDEGRNFIEVDCVSLDSYLQGEKVDFIKMDIQGGEAHAIEGWVDTLNSNPNLRILMEFSAQLIRKAGKDPLETISSLYKKGFHLRVFGGDERDYISVNDFFLDYPCHKEWNINIFLRRD